ncbi:hypothetical protein [uncultured Chryseobacterium sp.]|uniref:hypothetical protein n=1 Tax=uncultured Chryseobacterium sp. TaxID=259322 RepID=UPI0025CFDA32|nr:hypothetical protein [uncultured Chryseobacterium sp.]
MKKMTILFLVSFLSLNSCKKEAPVANPPATEKIETKAGGYTADYILSDKDGKAIAGFTVNPPKVQIGSETYTAKEKEDKRKYYSNGTQRYEVKLKDDTYKLRDAGSKLLWKVKTYPDKIKIADNEENLNPYEIKNNNGAIEVSKDGKVISTMKVTGNEISVNGQPAYKISKTSDSFALGILSIDQIPMDQRLLLLTEFLYQKK